MSDEDEFVPDPPDAADVMRRAAIMKYQFVYLATTPPPDLIARASQAWAPGERDQFVQQLESARRGLIDRLRADGLWEDTSPSERELFEQPRSAITERQMINGSWRAEAIHCLAWALGLVDEIPDYDTLTDPEILLPLVPTEDLAGCIRSSTLRGATEIERAREIAELWHWRSRTTRLQEDGYTPRKGQPSLDTIVRTVAKRMAADGMLPTAIDEDFPVLGRAYRDLSEDQRATVQSIAMERHLALNWLCGHAPGNEWDETPTDT
jgi:hypothetical protein